MLQNLKLADGSKLDLLANSFLMLEDSEGKGKGCTIVYSLIPGENLIDRLDMSYGVLKKKWVDSGALEEQLLEVTLAGESPRKAAFPGSFVIARKELTESDIGAKTRLTLNVNGKVIHLLVNDKRDTLVGEEQ